MYKSCNGVFFALLIRFPLHQESWQPRCELNPHETEVYVIWQGRRKKRAPKTRNGLRKVPFSLDRKSSFSFFFSFHVCTLFFRISRKALLWATIHYHLRIQLIRTRVLQMAALTLRILVFWACSSDHWCQISIPMLLIKETFQKGKYFVFSHVLIFDPCTK